MTAWCVAALRLLTALLASLTCGTAFADPTPLLEQQRQAFREAYPAAELGNWAPAAERASMLERYILWPDLRAVYLRTRAGTVEPAAVEAFLERYGALKAGRELRYRHVVQLAAAQQMSAYLDIYKGFYQGLGIARLDCLAAHAEILNGNGARIASRAMDLWLTGYSQANECDPVFDYLRGAGLLHEGAYRERFDLALSARQFSLARYLARSIDDEAFAQADQWLSAQSRPLAFLDSEKQYADDLPHRERVLLALERVAYTDARLADEHWHEIRGQRAFSQAQIAGMSRHIALWLARQHEADAARRLGELDEEARDAEVRRWLLRALLRQHAWDDVVAVIRSMPSDEQDSEESQYWLAIALLQRGDETTARTSLETLAIGRSYYGFLAADELGQAYAFAHASLTEDEEILSLLEKRDAVIRARELFHVGLESRGRSEWDDAVSLLGPEEKAQAAILAQRWGWHSRAIATAASIGLYDDLVLRYPLAYQEEFAEHSTTAGIPRAWAYGVARSESLFIPDIRSSAGAIGIMQLMPATGRRTASDLNLPWQGLATLTDPASNIRLGTSYLGQMLQQFADNRVAATAAYNAGPARVEKWLSDSAELDVRIWIENIPFNETRDYVRRVVVADAIFNWRLTGRTQRLTHFLGSIDPAVQQLAIAGKDRAGNDCDMPDEGYC